MISWQKTRGADGGRGRTSLPPPAPSLHVRKLLIKKIDLASWRYVQMVLKKAQLMTVRPETRRERRFVSCVCRSVQTKIQTWCFHKSDHQCLCASNTATSNLCFPCRGCWVLMQSVRLCRDQGPGWAQVTRLATGIHLFLQVPKPWRSGEFWVHSETHDGWPSQIWAGNLSVRSVSEILNSSPLQWPFGPGPLWLLCATLLGVLPWSKIQNFAHTSRLPKKSPPRWASIECADAKLEITRMRCSCVRSFMHLRISTVRRSSEARYSWVQKCFSVWNSAKLLTFFAQCCFANILFHVLSKELCQLGWNMR